MADSGVKKHPWEPAASRNIPSESLKLELVGFYAALAAVKSAVL
jgi:hypothetical protein